ncbi:MAG: alpha/beta fold hydrolase [Sphingomonadaceae bacterium]|nr:alpha/beta fold hydrolase [Sphingomonadaceae bacterium]
MSEWSWDPDPASGIRNRWVEANGLRFEVAEAGEGDRLALLLHGFPELNFSWRHQMPLLAELGYRVWAPNQRGYGHSSRPQGIAAYDADKLVADAAALIDASGAKEVTLVAHDWGGAIAWHFAIQRARPLARLVVMNCPHPACFARELRTWKQLKKSWYMFFFQLPWLPEKLLTANDARAIRGAFRDSAIDKSRFPRADLDVYARAAQAPGAMTAMVNWYRAAARNRTLTSGEAYPIIDVPTLLIWGEADMALDLATTEGTGDFVREFTLRRLPEVSHWVQQEAPEAVNAILREWLTA